MYKYVHLRWRQLNSSEKSCPEKSLRGYSTSYITDITLPRRLFLYWAGKRTVTIDSSALFTLYNTFVPCDSGSTYKNNMDHSQLVAMTGNHHKCYLYIVP